MTAAVVILSVAVVVTAILTLLVAVLWYAVPFEFVRRHPSPPLSAD